MRRNVRLPPFLYPNPSRVQLAVAAAGGIRALLRKRGECGKYQLSTGRFADEGFGTPPECRADFRNPRDGPVRMRLSRAAGRRTAEPKGREFMDIRVIRDYFGRVKPHHLRGETMRALSAALTGLKGVVALNAPLSTEIRSYIREASQLLARDEQIKKHLKAPLIYQAGQERQLFAVLAGVYKALLEETGREDHDAALARKQKIDHAYNLGMKLLSQGDVSEADAAFSEAIRFYRDEDKLFLLIGKALLEAGEVRRAVARLQEGLESLPGDPELQALLTKAVAHGRKDEPSAAQ